MLAQRVGRNDPCPCRSGRKYKVCCARQQASADVFLAPPVLPPRRVGGDGAKTRPAPVPHPTASAGDAIRRIPVHYTYAEPFGTAECVYCFPVDQLVILANGNVTRAEWLQAGYQFRMEDGGLGTVTAVEPPKVWPAPSRVPDRDGNYRRRVLGTIKHKGFAVLDVTFGGQTITGTPDHRWYSVSRRAWVPAQALRRGELLLPTQGTPVPVESVSEVRQGVVELYNVEVEELHTFFVGCGGQGSALVHNGDGNYMVKPAGPLKEVPISELKPLHTPAHSKPRPALQGLSDAELLQAARNPKNGDPITVNTRTGNLVNGNGRAHELQRRAADPNSSITPDTKVPVAEYTPDTSMFPDLP